MDLTFSKTNGVITCSTSASSNFNVHLEFAGTSLVRIYSSTLENGKAMLVQQEQVNECYDIDFNGLVFPKYITIEVSRMPTKAILTEV